jgi:AcrR family transcriptional regulator
MDDTNRVDRRVERTRNTLHRALLDLVTEKPYDKITVQEIIDRANIGRSTFYAHFKDKDDLLQAGMRDLKFDIRSGLSDENAPNVLISVQHIFEHAAENYRPYRALMSNTGLHRMRKSTDQSIAAAFLEHLETAHKQGQIEIPVPPIVLAQFIAGALHAMLMWWLEEQMPYPPAEMDAMFNRIIAGTVRDFATYSG